jgi:hypothetical protein
LSWALASWKLLVSWPLHMMNSVNYWSWGGKKFKLLELNPIVNRGKPNPKLVLHDIYFFLEVLSDLVELDITVGLQY